MLGMVKSILIIGATGLVGSEILRYALNDKRVKSVRIFVRNPSGVSHPKLKEFIVNFDQLADWRDELKGDVLFSALGTTKNQAGSREAQRVVDYDYQLRVAQCAKINGISNYVLVSAPNAHPQSSLAYNKMKGDLERDVMKLSFEKITIIRPGLLQGPRASKRMIEYAAGVILNKVPTIPGLEAFKPVSGKLVAHACIEAAFDESFGQRIFHPKDVLQFLRV